MEELDRRTLLRRAGLGRHGRPGRAGRLRARPARATRSGGRAHWLGRGRAQFELDPARRHFAAFVLASHPGRWPRPSTGTAAASGPTPTATWRTTASASTARPARPPPGTWPTAAPGPGPGPARVHPQHHRQPWPPLWRPAPAGRPGGRPPPPTTSTRPTRPCGCGPSGPGPASAGSSSTRNRPPSPATGWSPPSAVGSAPDPRARPHLGPLGHGRGKLPLAEICDAVAEHNRDRDREDRVLVCADAVHALGVEPDAVPPKAATSWSPAATSGCSAPRHRPGLGPARRRGHRHRPGLQRRGHRRLDQRRRPSRLPLGPVRAGRVPRLRAPLGLAEAFGSTWTWASSRSPTAPGPGHPPQGRPGRDPGGPPGHPRDPDLSAGIVCLEAGAHDPGEVVAILRRQGILASVTPYARPTCASVPALSPPRRTSTRPSGPFRPSPDAAP